MPGKFSEITHQQLQAVVFNQKPEFEPISSHTFWLSEDGRPDTIAHNLFELIQRLDQQGFDELYVELSVDRGIGKAINDRLHRAAAK